MHKKNVTTSYDFAVLYTPFYLFVDPKFTVEKIAPLRGPTSGGKKYNTKYYNNLTMCPRVKARNDNPKL